MSRFGPRLLVAAGGGFAALGLGVAVAFVHPGTAILGFALVGIGAANIVPAVLSASTRAGASPSGGIALATAVGYAGFLSGPPLIGSIAAVVGLRFAVMCLVPAAALAAVTGFWVFERRRRAF